MIRWFHATFSAYGFWLPNDPRGSWSDFVHAWELYRVAGPATKVTGKRSYAADPHDVSRRRLAKLSLKHPVARFDAAARESIGRGFGEACDEFGFVIHACAIGYDHAHLVLRRQSIRTAEQIVSVLKARATRQMRNDRTHPMLHLGETPVPSPWGRGSWSVFIDDEKRLQNAIDYVRRHPSKEGLSRQEWDFVRPVFG